MLLLVLLAFTAAFAALVAAVMWAARRWLGKWPAVAIGGALFVYLAYSMVAGMMYCAAEPIYIPPTAEQAALGSDGGMRFNCDGPGGAGDYLSLYLIAPLLLIFLAKLIGDNFRKRELQ